MMSGSVDRDRSVVCALFEGHHAWGVGALLNSLYHQRFRGIAWIGYRGDLPAWAQGAQAHESYRELTLPDGLRARFVPVDPPIHLAYYKPQFILDTMERCSQAENFFYFDADIVVKRNWKFFEDWVEWGVALCQDNANSFMASDHPDRLSWLHFAGQHGWEGKRSIERYFNAGFIGLSRQHKEILNFWREVIGAVGKTGIDLREPPKGLHRLFYYADQDALNLVLMLTECPLTTLGPEAMSFTPGAAVMTHAIGNPKPWRKNLLREYWARRPLSASDEAFWHYAGAPIPLYSRPHIRWKRALLRCCYRKPR